MALTNAELEHHLGICFNLLKEQSEAMTRIVEKIDKNQHISATADRMIEEAVRKMISHGEMLESRINELADCPDCNKEKGDLH